MANSWKAKHHYLRNGTEWTGYQHSSERGVLYTGKTKNKNSKKLYHFMELSKTAQKKVMGSKKNARKK